MTQETTYDFAALSIQGGSVTSSLGISIETQAIGWGAYDTLLISGSAAIPEPIPELITVIQQAARATQRIASICTGAFVLAATGLLDGKHAKRIGRFEDKIFVKDGTIWSSAGVTACIDLALALVESDLGSEVAKTISRMMVVYHRRTGGQSQFSTLAALEPSSDRIKEALCYAKEHLHKDLSVEDLAAHVHWSPRHFSRVFQAQTGLAPAKAIERLRIEAAQALIEQGYASVARIAQLVGFGDEERMRRSFIRSLGQTPKALIHQARNRNEYVYLT